MLLLLCVCSVLMCMSSIVEMLDVTYAKGGLCEEHLNALVSMSDASYFAFFHKRMLYRTVSIPLILLVARAVLGPRTLRTAGSKGQECEVAKGRE